MYQMLYARDIQGLRHAISTLLPRYAMVSSEDPLVLQYELQHQQPDFTCGGGYMTFFQSDAQSQQQFDEKTPYSLRFGADQCGRRREIIFKVNSKCRITEKRYFYLPCRVQPSDSLSREYC